MKTLTQVKAIAKKRHELLNKRLEKLSEKNLDLMAQEWLDEKPSEEQIKKFKENTAKHMDEEGIACIPKHIMKKFIDPSNLSIKIADIYETMAIEAGFKDWNAYSAFLKSEPANKYLEGQKEPLTEILATMGWKLAPLTAKVITSHITTENTLGTDYLVVLGIMSTYPELRCFQDSDIIESDDMKCLQYCATSKDKGVWFPSLLTDNSYFFKGITDKELAELVKKHTTKDLDNIGFMRYENIKNDESAFMSLFEDLTQKKFESFRKVHTFKDLVFYLFQDEDFMKEYDRLRGTRFTKKFPTTTIESMIDNATGHKPSLDEKHTLEFIKFVKDYIWDRLEERSFEPLKVP